jgi:hypothetical protein
MSSSSLPEERVPLNSADIEAGDEAMARELAAQEVSSARAREMAANARAWDAYYSRQYPYYYGTWRAPPPRPVIVYHEEDPFLSLWFLW